MYAILAYEDLLCLFNFWIKIPMTFSWGIMRSDHRGLRLERTDSDRCFALVSSRRSTGGMHAFYCYVKSKGHAIGPFYQSAIAFSQNKVQEGSKRWTVEVKLLLSDTLS